MPWKIVANHRDCPSSKPFGVINKQTGRKVACHATKAGAQKQLAALNANVTYSKEGVSMEATTRPPRDDLVRAVQIAPELDEDESRENGDGMTLSGHFAVFDQWTEINSMFEGNFMERFAPGAFKRTINNNGEQMRVLLQHGRDPVLGDKPIGSIRDLGEDSTGAYYKVRLFDGIPPLVLDGLRDGQYGASHRFRVVGDNFERDVEPSDYNPDGLPERTVTEAQVMEFGPVTFPAYAGATAGVRSLTDAFILERLLQNPEQLMELVAQLKEIRGIDSHDDARPDGHRRGEKQDAGTPGRSPTAKAKRDYLNTKEASPKWKL